MFEVHMDEYLEEETEYVKQALDVICRTWDQQVWPCIHLDREVR